MSKALDLLREWVEESPLNQDPEDSPSRVWYCRYCMGYGVKAQDVQHTEACLWERTRAFVAQAPTTAEQGKGW